MKFGIVVFPGSNCDHDAFYAASLKSGSEAEYIWHKDTALPQGIDCIILPGGFSYGDYLRCGAIARFSPLMNQVIKFAERGGAVIGICNGFQILTEAGLLPGALLRNTSLHFLCRDVFIKSENSDSPFTYAISTNDVLRIPIAHNEGNYFADPDTIKMLEDSGRIAFRYCDSEGRASIESNPNGSVNNIAGIISENGRILGMMPHPERYSDKMLGFDDGLKIFQSIEKYFNS